MIVVPIVITIVVLCLYAVLLLLTFVFYSFNGFKGEAIARVLIGLVVALAVIIPTWAIYNTNVQGSASQKAEFENSVLTAAASQGFSVTDIDYKTKTLVVIGNGCLIEATIADGVIILPNVINADHPLTSETVAELCSK